jgi:hypothetical protein
LKARSPRHPLTVIPALSREFVEDAVRLIVTRFIPLSPSDIEDWVADPEEWMNMEDPDSEQWEFLLRVQIVSLPL